VSTYVVYRDDPWGRLFKEDLLKNGISAEEMAMEYNREDEPDAIAGNVEEFLADKGHINVAVLAFTEAESILEKLLGSERISDENRYYLGDGYYSDLEKLTDKLEELGRSDRGNPETLAQLFHSNSSGFLATSPDSYEYEDDMELAEAQKDFLSQHEGEYATNTYDAVVLLGLAYLSAGSAEPDALARALSEISNPPGKCISYEECAMQIQNEETDINYEGLSGRIDFDEKGDIKGAAYKILSYFDRMLEEMRSVAP
jgi:branched-chain amino acid transport system substrate-binding protein